ncbi:hypothetical protein Lfu02_55960 [Longispora fulva]|uniref:Uncharacterized protein n=1 Tax=Longispora fulva TaxID=619741 RepID=A0A8J7KL16_9ACTN|nr:hypothetical protein [Longispora fulva]MBG6137421.1 hypothetical protein [Longispora fulva]GIG61224.1 hypothetical protein Lfu02_55960 [Longispora fulva]
MNDAMFRCRAYVAGEFVDAELWADRFVLGGRTLPVAEMSEASTHELGLLTTVGVTVAGERIEFDAWQDEAERLCDILATLTAVNA